MEVEGSTSVLSGSGQDFGYGGGMTGSNIQTHYNAGIAYELEDMVNNILTIEQ